MNLTGPMTFTQICFPYILRAFSQSLTLKALKLNENRTVGEVKKPQIKRANERERTTETNNLLVISIVGHFAQCFYTLVS